MTSSAVADLQPPHLARHFQVLKGEIVVTAKHTQNMKIHIQSQCLVCPLCERGSVVPIDAKGSFKCNDLTKIYYFV